MAINFDQLPTENPFSAPAPGIYKAKIIEAVMAKNKTDASKSPYLSLKYQLTKADGTNGGSIYDSLSESDSSVVQYKIARFLQACKIPLVGAMELSDIGKLALNKEIVVDVTQNYKEQKEKGSPARGQVDVFAHEAYYPIEQFAEIYALVNAGSGEEVQLSQQVTGKEAFMNIPDAVGADGAPAEAVEY